MRSLPITIAGLVPVDCCYSCARFTEADYRMHTHLRLIDTDSNWSHISCSDTMKEYAPSHTYYLYYLTIHGHGFAQ